MLVCRGSAVTSRGLSSLTNGGAFIRSSCTTSLCSLQTVDSPGTTSSEWLWPLKTCFHSWMVRTNSSVLYRGLTDHKVHKLLSVLRDVLCERLPNLTPVHRHELTRYLTDTCVTRRRLFQAVVGGAADMSIVQLHLEVQLPPTPCPLAQGTDLHEGETQQLLAKVTSALQQKEEELRSLREGSRVTLSEVSLPEDEHLDKQSILELVRAAVRATKGQIEESLNHEATLLGDILQLKVQQAALATRRHHNTVSSNTAHNKRPDMSAKAKSKTRVRKTGNAV
ncbi:uncharacterized protein C8orf74 homolog isoform X2 [Amphiprion ocellaris]|uniref:uncharacterized protein C8orf74 homolog isoform X2 n=1 Tax=Amphiprion ocellaris TaxID=80972 RepID=UPI002411057A|nr:uncharacterized protein C8orf74 homolog isoform X2 [Amphiprion ocellaris]